MKVDVDGCSDAAVIHGVSKVIVPEDVEIDLSSYPPGDVTQLEGDTLASTVTAADTTGSDARVRDARDARLQII